MVWCKAATASSGTDTAGRHAARDWANVAARKTLGVSAVEDRAQGTDAGHLRKAPSMVVYEVIEWEPRNCRNANRN